MTEPPGAGTAGGGAGAGGAGAGPDVGSLAEEAARLAEALQGWAGRDRTGLLGGHLATGSAECLLCPICRLIALAREAGPEVYDHLADAAASLARAVRTLADAQRSARRPAGGVEHIDLDDEGEDVTWD